MAITVTATVTCDMCGREEAVVLRENSRHGRVEAALMDIARMVPHWDMLMHDGYSVKDCHVGDGKVLCEPCANRYRDAIAEKQRAIDALFE